MANNVMRRVLWQHHLNLAWQSFRSVSTDLRHACCAKLFFNCGLYFLESHFWPFKEVDEEGTAYKDVLNDYDLSTKFYTSPIEPGRSLRLSEKNTYLELKESVRDDCLTDPQLCFKTGLTIGLWLKRKGNNSLSSRQSNVCNA